MKMPTDKQASELEFTKEELAGLLYPGVPFDVALPQAWVDLVSNEHFDPRMNIVWGYPKGGYAMGTPLALTTEAYLSLIFIADKLKKGKENG